MQLSSCDYPLVFLLFPLCCALSELREPGTGRQPWLIMWWCQQCVSRGRLSEKPELHLSVWKSGRGVSWARKFSWCQGKGLRRRNGLLCMLFEKPQHRTALWKLFGLTNGIYRVSSTKSQHWTGKFRGHCIWVFTCLAAIVWSASAT